MVVTLTIILSKKLMGFGIATVYMQAFIQTLYHFNIYCHIYNYVLFNLTYSTL